MFIEVRFNKCNFIQDNKSFRLFIRESTVEYVHQILYSVIYKFDPLSSHKL